MKNDQNHAQNNAFIQIATAKSINILITASIKNFLWKNFIRAEAKSTLVENADVGVRRIRIKIF